MHNCPIEFAVACIPYPVDTHYRFFVDVILSFGVGAHSMRPKAAATPAATTPDPYSRPKAIIVAAAALEVEVDAVEAVEAVVEAAVAVAELEDDEVEEGAAVKFAMFRVPQFLFRFCVQTSWAAWSFWPAAMQLA